MFDHGQVFLIKNRFYFLLIKTNFLHTPVTRKWPYFYKDTFMFEASKGLSPSLAFYHDHACFPLPLLNFRETPLSTSSILALKWHKNTLKIILCGCCRLEQTAEATIPPHQNEGYGHPTHPWLLLPLSLPCVINNNSWLFCGAHHLAALTPMQI